MFMVPLAELATKYAGFYVPIVPVSSVILTVALITRGQVGRFWHTTIAKPWMLLLAVFLAAAVLGTYPRMSTSFMIQYGARLHLLPFYCCAFLLTPRQVRHCMYWIAGGAVLLLVLCLRIGEYAEGRLFIPETSLSNPNDLGFALLLGTTCLLLFLYARSVTLRVLWVFALPLSIFFILRTGSRANFITLLVLIPVVFIMISRRAKFAMFVLCPVAVVILAFAIPKSTFTRLTLILVDPKEDQADDLELRGAIGSQIARVQLQKNAIELTLHRPFLGVGALMFENAVEKMVRAETGKKSGWQGAHNTYLEISAENGIPALILYLWVLFLCFRMNYASFQTCNREPRQRAALGQSLCLILMAVAYCIGIAFCNAAYDGHLDILVALSTANYLAIRAETERLKALPPASARSSA